jgi:hypothetical protein
VKTHFRERGHGLVGSQVEALLAELCEFASDVQAGDVELHVVPEAAEDDLLGDAGVEFGT